MRSVVRIFFIVCFTIFIYADSLTILLFFIKKSTFEHDLAKALARKDLVLKLVHL